jgi:hypothetical protein
MSDLLSATTDLQSRRSFLLNSGMGLGTTALASLLPQIGGAAPRGLHHTARAKRIIFLFMAGAPSQVDLFDHKPDLHKLFRTELPGDDSNWWPPPCSSLRSRERAESG